MVIKGLKQFTNFAEPKELILTQYGVIKRIDWQERESRKYRYGQVIKNEHGFTAVFIKDEEAYNVR
jgi:hypothetical protein